MLPRPARWTQAVLPAAVLAFALSACADDPSTGLDGASEPDAPVTREIVDANNGDPALRNDHFFWLAPIIAGNEPEGVPLTNVNPVLLICALDLDDSGTPIESGTACGGGEAPLAEFTRDDDARGIFDTLRQFRSGDFALLWNTRRYDTSNGSYRISVRVADNLILGYADVIFENGRLRRALKSGRTNGLKGLLNALKKSDGEFVSQSPQGSLRIAFRIEEGALEQAVANSTDSCDPDGDGVIDCDVEPGEADESGSLARDIVVVVEDEGDQSGNNEEEVTTVVVIPAGTPITDASGSPFTGDFVLILENVEETENGQTIVDVQDNIDGGGQVPFYAHITTDPAGLQVGGFTNPRVVVCQDVTVLDQLNGGVGVSFDDLLLFRIPADQAGNEFPDSLPQLIPTNIDANGDCEPLPHANGPTQGASLWDHLKSLFTPRELVARRAHGGLNTVMTSPRRFSNWGTTIRFDAGQSLLSASAPVPAFPGDGVTLQVELNNAAGAPYNFDVVGFIDDGNGILEYGGNDTPIPLDLRVTVTFDDGNTQTTTVLFDAGANDPLSLSGIEVLPGFTPTAPGTYTFEATVDLDGPGPDGRTALGGSPAVIVVTQPTGSFSLTPPPPTTVTVNPVPSMAGAAGLTEPGATAANPGMVSVVAVSPFPIVKTNSEAEPTLTFDELEPGDYIVELEKDGFTFNPSSFIITVGAGQNQVLDLSELTVITPDLAVGTGAGVEDRYYAAVPAGFAITWQDARAQAQALGGELVVITSALENEFLVCNVLPGSDRLWIGLQETPPTSTTVREDRAWTWVTQDPAVDAFRTFDSQVYQNWDPDGINGGEPNNTLFNGARAEHQVEIFSNGRWNDIAVGDPFQPQGFLVEFQGVGPFPEFTGCPGS